MIKALVLACGVGVVPHAFAFGGGDVAEGWAAIIRAEVEAGRPALVLHDYVPDFSLAFAYDIQQALVRAKANAGEFAGYKIEFADPDVARAAGLSGPAAGILFTDGVRRERAVINLRSGQKLGLEVEIGFELRSAILRPLKSVDDLATYLRQAMLVVEMPDAQFSDNPALNELDRIAMNLGSGLVVTGPAISAADLERIDQEGVTLRRGDDLVAKSLGVGAVQRQLEVLLRSVNQLHAHGRPLNPGQILITGALGPPFVATRGRYRAEIGESYRLSFILVDKPTAERTD